MQSTFFALRARDRSGESRPSVREPSGCVRRREPLCAGTGTPAHRLALVSTTLLENAPGLYRAASLCRGGGNSDLHSWLCIRYSTRLFDRTFCCWVPLPGGLNSWSPCCCYSECSPGWGALFSTILALQLYVGLSAAPGEWYWTYGMLVLLSLALLSVPTGRRLGLDQWLSVRLAGVPVTRWRRVLRALV